MSRSREGLQPNSHAHRVFLSHSGVNKAFVADLAGKLKRYHYDPFFDKNSLRVGDTADMTLILEIMATSKLAVFVLSEAFFTQTPNPMLELLAAVDHQVPMLPLFYDLLAPQVKDEGRRESWKMIWQKWSESDSRIDAEEFEQAVKQLANVTGIEYKQSELNIYDYIDKIVEEVCNKVLPDTRPFDGNIVGKDRLCKEVDNMFELSPVVNKACRVLALHGMEGMGKTMLCNALYNEYFSKFEGRVCHLKLSEQSQLECMNEILTQLMNFERPAFSKEVQALKVLVDRLPKTKKFFLIFDNIQDSEQKIGLDLSDLLQRFPKESKVLLLARSKSILMKLLNGRGMIAEFPSLNPYEAKSLFLSKTIFFAQEENDILQLEKEICKPPWQGIIDRCLNLCTVKGNKYDMYHPHMVESLATYVRNKVLTKRLHLRTWKSVLVELEKDRKPGMEPVFKNLTESFNSLPEEHARSLFLDIALYGDGKDGKWLHSRMQEGMDRIIELLKDAAFLSKDGEISDIHTDFAKMRAKKSETLIYTEGSPLEDSLSVSDILMDKRKLPSKVAFKSCNFQFEGAALDLSNHSGIEFLLLDGNKGLKSVNLGQNRLRYVDIRFLDALNVQGHDALVTGFAMESKKVDFKRQCRDCSLLSMNFENFWIFGLTGLPSELWRVDSWLFEKCVDLKFVQLHNVELPHSELQLSCWPRLQNLKLSHLPNLTNMHSLESLKFLRELKLSDLINLTSLRGISSLSQLEHFEVAKCTELLELHVPCFLNQCKISSCDGLKKIVVGTNDNDPVSQKDMRLLCDILMFSPIGDAESTDEDENYSENCFSVCSSKNLIELNGISKLTSIDDFYFNFAEVKGKFQRVKTELGFRLKGPRCGILLNIS